MWVINPAVGCHYFPPEGCYQFRCLVNRGTMSVSSLPKTVTRQRRGCDLNPGPSVPESSTLTTRLPSHPGMVNWLSTSCHNISDVYHSVPSVLQITHGRLFLFDPLDTFMPFDTLKELFSADRLLVALACSCRGAIGISCARWDFCWATSWLTSKGRRCGLEIRCQISTCTPSSTIHSRAYTTR